MNFEQAVRKSIKKFYEGVEPEKVSKVRPREITKEYLDGLEDELLAEKRGDGASAAKRRAK